MFADRKKLTRMAEATLAYELGQEAGGVPKKRKMTFVLAGAAALVAVIAGGAYLLFSGRSEKPSDLAQNLETIKKEGLSPVTRSAGPPRGMAAAPIAPTDEGLAKLRESFGGKAYQETVRLAEEGLIGGPGRGLAQDYLQ